MSEELQKAQLALSKIKQVEAERSSLAESIPISTAELIPLIEPILKILDRLESQLSQD